MLIDSKLRAHQDRKMVQNLALRSLLYLSVLSLFFGGAPTWAQGEGQDGEALAKLWCSSCHLYPEPALLTQKIWVETVLPNMGARLGIGSFGDRIYHGDPSAPAGVYAAEPLMSAAEWAQINAWYQSQAPDQLELPAWQPRSRLELFSTEVPPVKAHDFPTGTAVFIDEAARRLLVGDGYELDLEIYAADLRLLETVRPGGIVSRIARTESGSYLATIIGGTIGQTEQLHGTLVEISAEENSPVPSFVNRVVKRLHRPVSFEPGDFNKDGVSDFVIAEFGTHFGALSVHIGQPDGVMGARVLLDQAGATSIGVFEDDLLVLMAQGDERIVRFKDFSGVNPGASETILRFPPSQGSSSMSVLDFNGDGLMDLLYTAGDNADISPIFKPYHGVYLFFGQPDDTYELEMFFHLDGATSAVAEDFDQDGDLDIAVIAYYPNIDRGLDQSGFVYLENVQGKFDPHYIEGLGALGRFVAISVGDIDGDGDKDIALANLAFGPYGPLKVSPELQAQWLAGTGFVLLRNQLN